MKYKFAACFVLLISITGVARVIVPFSNWEQLKQASNYILIVHCGKPIPAKPNVLIVGGVKSDSEVQVVSFLKGTNNTNIGRVQTDFELQVDKNYLIFGNFDDGVLKAFEEYRVVPLQDHFSTNLIAEKTLDEQIRILLKSRLDNLNRQMQKDQEEKQRLESALN